MNREIAIFEPKDTMFVSPKIPDAPIANQPLIGIIDTGFAINNPDINYENITLGTDFVDGDANPLLFEGEGSEHGTHVLGIIAAEQDNGEGIDGINDDAPIWLGRAIGSGKWADSLVEFVNHAIESEQPNAVVNLSLDLTQIDANGNVTTRYELTPTERAAIEYARQSNVLLVVGAGNDGGVMSALGQASQEFDNIITVGAAERVGEEFADAKAFDRAGYSSYGQGLNILAPGGTVENPELSLTDDGVGAMAGTSVATAKVTGAISQVWAANPALSYRQVIEIVKDTATDLGLVGFDNETSAGLLNQAAAVLLAKVTVPEVHVAPSSVIPDSWSGEGSYIAGERAVATQFNGKYYEWKSYKIVSGDTLGAIAQRTMGNGSAAYYNFIAQKNGIANPNLISVGQTIQVPYEVAPPVVTQPQVGRGSRSPQIFQAAYNKINGTSQGLKLQGDAYRWGNGWTQKFWDKNGSEMLLMLEDGASEAFWMWYGNLGEYQQMGGAIGHLGYPRSNEIALPNKPAGSIYQVFATGNGKSRIHYSPKTGSIATWGSIGRQYTDLGGAYHWLGMPTRREYAYGSDTIFSDFEGGKIAHQKSTGRVEVLRPGQTPSWLNQPTNLPQTLAGKKILLDPGHGITSTGFDPGAVGNGTTEAIENLHQAKLIADHLRKLGADVKVLDEPLSLSQIGQRAAGNDIFVSLHQNAFNKSVQGHEVLYKPNGNPKNIQLAQIINNELDKAFPDSIIPNRNIKPRNDLSVLNNALNSVPTVLVESLFIDSSGMSRANVEKAAIAVASGIEKFFTGNVTSNGSNGSVPQAPLATPGQTRQYIIKSGDTLSGIALRELGNAERWREIKKANGSTFTEAEARNLQVGQSVYLPVSYQSGTGTPVTSSPTSTPKTTNNINWVNFSGTVGPSIGVNLRNSPKFSNRSSFNEPYNKTLEFDGWTYGETGTDMWTGQPDNRWFKIKGKNLWVPSCYIWGNPPSNGGGDNGNGGSNTVPNPLLTRQGISYFTSRSQFYGASGNGYAKHGFGSSVNGTNAYREGNCTWYAYGRLKELGVNPDNIMNGYPHANEWGKSLRNGATIVSSPKAGDVAQWHLNGQNHVAIVEKVEGNYIWISESQAYGDYDGNLPGSEIYPGAGTLHRVMKYTKNVPHRYIRL
jgi:N-acetylmuramoyl-L-alanine amidase/nucleoid-associated protein YgaU/surface antigen